LPPDESQAKVSVIFLHVLIIDEPSCNVELEQRNEDYSSKLPRLFPDDTSLDSITTFVFAANEVNGEDCYESMFDARVVFC